MHVYMNAKMNETWPDLFVSPVPLALKTISLVDWSIVGISFEIGL